MSKSISRFGNAYHSYLSELRRSTRSACQPWYTPSWQAFRDRKWSGVLACLVLWKHQAVSEDGLPCLNIWAEANKNRNDEICISQLASAMIAPCSRITHSLPNRLSTNHRICLYCIGLKTRIPGKESLQTRGPHRHGRGCGA